MGNLATAERILRLIDYLQKSPKTMEQITEHLGVKKRAIYEYLNLIDELKYKVKTPKTVGGKKYSISRDKGMTPLTEQESAFLRNVLGPYNEVLAQNILSKIFENAENGALTWYGKKKKIGEIGSKLESAIENKFQVKLINYGSVHTNSIRDRIVEPHQITQNYDALISFELESMENRTFKLSRMENVEILETKFQYETLHKSDKRDIFGFSGHLDKEIVIEMKFRAYDLLKTQFPLSENCTKEKESKKERIYILKTMVTDFTVPTRFVLGLPGEVRVKGSQEFKNFIEVVRRREWK
jgi:proteasome accessory factor C